MGLKRKRELFKIFLFLLIINLCIANYSHSKKKFSRRSLQAVSPSTYLAPVDNIPPGTILTSENGFWIFKLTDTGLLQVQDSFGNILYSINTSITGTAPFKMRFGTDAKINVLDSLNSVKYSSTPSSPTGGVYRLILQNDGHLIVKQASNIVIWYGKSTHNLSSEWPSQGSMNIYTSSNFGEFSLTEMSTEYDLEGDGDVFNLEKHTLDCGAKAAMNYFVLQRISLKYRYFYKCIKSDNISTTCKNLSTPLNSVNSPVRLSLHFLDRHTINCDTGDVLKGFKVTRVGNQLKYDYTCCTAKLEGTCNSTSTGSTDAGDWFTPFIDRQAVNAGAGKVFKSFQLKSINGDWLNPNKIYYAYTACNLSTLFNTDSDNLGSPLTSFLPEQSARKCQCNSGCFNLDSTKATMVFEKFQTASVDSQNSNLKILNFDAYGSDFFIGMFAGTTTCKYNILIGVTLNSKIRVAQSTETYISACDTNYSANVASKTTYQLIVDNTAKSIKLNVNGSQIVNCSITNLDFASITNWAYSGNTSQDGSKSQTICPLTSNVSSSATNCKWRDPSVTIYDQTNYLGNSFTLSKPLLNTLGISFTSVKSIKFNPECFTPCSNCFELGTVSDHKCCSCKTNYFPLSDNTSQCYTTAAPPAFYWFSTTQFKPCYSSCSTCSNDGTDSTHNCLNCKTGFYKINSTSNCVNSTPSNYYFNTNSNEYRPCYSNCNTCSADGTESIMECLTCKSGFYTLIDNSKNCYNSTPQFYFYDTTIQKYNKCYSTCNTCSSTGASDNHSCLVCKNTYFKIENTNNCFLSSDTIPKYFYSAADSLFKSCVSNCNVCSDSTTCTTCINGYNKITGTSNCVNSTPSNHYFNTNSNEYRPCYTSCNTCSADGTATNMECLTCKSGFYSLIDNSKNCFNSSPQFYFFDTNIQKYSNCYSTCNTCSSTGSSNNHNCLVCKNTYFKIENTNNCFLSSDTIPKYFYSAADSLFKSCVSNCNVCSDSTTCTTCVNGYYKIMGTSNCVNSTPSNYYLNTNSNEYRPCYTNCNTCSADGTATNMECLTCKSLFYPLVDNSKNCFNSSPQFYFYDTTIQKYNNCYSSCKTCSSIGSSNNHNCLICKDNNYKVENSNNCFLSSDTVPQFFFSSTDSLFKGCPLNCKVCPNSTSCTTCVSGYFKTVSNTCDTCYNTCDTCLEVGTQADHKCETCKTNYSLKQGTKDCLLSSTIIPGFYLNIQQNKFIPCTQNCLTCNESSCTSCESGYTVDPTGKCVACYSSCNTCTGVGTQTDQKCSACKTNFFPQESTKNCFASNESVNSYFFDSAAKIFRSCYNTCSSCTVRGVETDHKCTNCNPNFFYKDLTSSCYPSGLKMDQFYFDSSANKFLKCPPGCKICNNQSTCLQCLDGFNLKLDKTCLNLSLPLTPGCFATCGTCDEQGDSKNNKCKTCRDGHYLLENTNNCIQENSFIQGFYVDLNLKLFTKCISGCSSCKNKDSCDSCLSTHQLDTNTKTCQRICYGTCRSCEELGTGTDHKCTLCKDGLFFQSKTSNCFSPESSLYTLYFNKITKMFEKCPENCSSCLDNNGLECTNCVTGYFFENSSKKCINCYPSCKYCKTVGTINDHQCIDCKNSTFIKIENNCYEAPKDFFFFNSNEKTYSNCENDCIGCENDIEKYCTLCRVNKTSMYNSMCVPFCPSGNKPDKFGRCKPCQYFSQLIFEGNCIDKCPEKYINANGRCQQNCPDGKYIFNSTCVQNCPDNYISDSRVFECLPKIDVKEKLDSILTTELEKPLSDQKILQLSESITSSNTTFTVDLAEKLLTVFDAQVDLSVSGVRGNSVNQTVTDSLLGVLKLGDLALFVNSKELSNHTSKNITNASEPNQLDSKSSTGSSGSSGYSTTSVSGQQANKLEDNIILVKAKLDNLIDRVINATDSQDMNIKYVAKTMAVRLAPHDMLLNENSVEDDISVIDFSECINLIQQKNNLSDNSNSTDNIVNGTRNLAFLGQIITTKKVDYKSDVNVPKKKSKRRLDSNPEEASQTGNVSNTPVRSGSVKLELYDPVKKQKMDTSACNETQVKYKIPLNISAVKRTANINSLKKYNLDFFDEESLPYTSRCFKLIDEENNNTDTTVNMRRKNFYMGQVLCANNCVYKGMINYTVINCDCQGLEKEETYFTISDKNLDVFSSVNIDIFKCGPEAFNKVKFF